MLRLQNFGFIKAGRYTYALRNEDILLIALAQLIANLLSAIDGHNTGGLIDTFSKNIHMLAGKTKDNNAPIYN